MGIIAKERYLRRKKDLAIFYCCCDNDRDVAVVVQDIRTVVLGQGRKAFGPLK